MTIYHKEEEEENFSETISTQPALVPLTPPTMNCPNCHQQMMDGDLGVVGAVLAVWPPDSKTPDWRSLTFDNMPKPRTAVSQQVKVCSRCGLVQLFAADPSIFRPAETRGLPRPAEACEVGKDTLPRAVDVE